MLPYKNFSSLKKKLIYKAEKLVNWDTVLKTAISDLEVDQREMNSKIYYIKYPIDKSSEFITNQPQSIRKSYPNHPKIISESSQNIPKSLNNPLKIYPTSS